MCALECACVRIILTFEVWLLLHFMRLMINSMTMYLTLSNIELSNHSKTLKGWTTAQPLVVIRCRITRSRETDLCSSELYLQHLLVSWFKEDSGEEHRSRLHLPQSHTHIHTHDSNICASQNLSLKSGVLTLLAYFNTLIHVICSGHRVIYAVLMGCTVLIISAF